MAIVGNHAMPQGVETMPLPLRILQDALHLLHELAV